MALRERGGPWAAPRARGVSLRIVAPSLYTVAGMAVLGAILIVALARPLDTDLWWHLATGSFIFHHHAVPSTDFMSFTFAGHAWTDQEWLSELTMYCLYRLAGLWGPIAFFSVVICLTYAVLLTSAWGETKSRIVGLFVVTMGFVASVPFWGARPQMVTLCFLAVYGLLLGRYRRTQSWRTLLGFPLVMLIWTNAHGGFVLGLLLLGLTVGGEWVNRLTRHEGALPKPSLRALTGTLGVTVLVTLINPLGVRQLLYPLVWIVPSAYTNWLTEWVSPDFHMPLMVVFELMVLLLVAAALVARPPLNWVHALLVVAFTHLALGAVRNVAVWVVVIGPILALYLDGAGAVVRREFGRQSTGRTMPPRVAAALNLGLLAAISLLYLAQAVHYVNPTMLAHSERADFPSRAVAYMGAHRLPPRVFAAYAWGGYVLWKLYPHYRDFIDGRANTLFDTRLLEDYLDAYAAAPSWKRVLQRHVVGSVLVPPSAPIAQVLAQDKAWQRVYSDSQAVLFIRRGTCRPTRCKPRSQRSGI